MADFKEFKISKRECFGCIRKGICYSDEDKVGWCDECSICPNKDCNNQIKYRIHWTVSGCSGEFNLSKDVCEKHSKKPDDCSCSKESTVDYKTTYVYF